MSKPETIPSCKTNKHMSGRLTHKTQKFKSLCEKEKYMGKTKMLPSHP